MVQRRNWQRPEQMLALELYLITPFGRIHSKNPEIISLASRIQRTPSAVALKMSNFAALDPTIDRKGMGNYSRSDGEIWEEFFENPAVFLDRLGSVKKARYQHLNLTSDIDQDNHFRVGEDIPVQTTRRRNQDFFRTMILAAYNNKCAVSSISQPELLIASHILKWSECEKERLNPRNGILLNALHDRAFENGLITFGEGYEMIISKSLKLSDMARPFFESKSLTLPEKFRPDQAFLSLHRENRFIH